MYLPFELFLLYITFISHFISDTKPLKLGVYFILKAYHRSILTPAKVFKSCLWLVATVFYSFSLYFIKYICVSKNTYIYLFCMHILSFIKVVVQIMDFKNFCSVQSLSHVQLFATPWTCSMPGFPVHHQLLELTQAHVH